MVKAGWFSLNSLALLYLRYDIMNLCVGWPGSVHDTGVLSMSELYKRGDAGMIIIILATSTATHRGYGSPLLNLGDAAYTVGPTAMTYDPLSTFRAVNVSPKEVQPPTTTKSCTHGGGEETRQTLGCCSSHHHDMCYPAQH